MVVAIEAYPGRNVTVSLGTGKVIGLPLLTLDDSKSKAEFSFERTQELHVIMAIHTSSGGFKILRDQSKVTETCLPPIKIRFSENTLYNCALNISNLASADDEIFELYLLSETKLSPLSISIRKPNGYYVKKDTWPTDKFRKFFLVNKSLSTSTNVTITVYLTTLHLRLTVDRDKSKDGSLQLRLTVDAQYATKSPLAEIVTILLRVEHIVPNAGILQWLETSGGVLGALMVLHTLIQWLGVVKRGGPYIAIVPLLAGSISDAIYFATLLSTLHAFAAEAGTIVLTIPLSQAEEKLIEALIFSLIFLKSLKVIWMNWKQCRCDLFFVDWSKYNSSLQDTPIQDKSNNWKTDMLAREWTSLQTKRRVSTGYTVTLTLLVLHLLTSWQSNIRNSRGYKWVVTMTAWWCSYLILALARFVIDRFAGTHSTRLIKVCTDLELSLLVFQEEYYAHYVNGRNDESMDLRSMTHPLSSCRVVCAYQLRDVYKKLITAGGLLDTHSNVEVLSQFLAAFFERALDGLHWVASERTLFERLFDVEYLAREGGSTTTLLYDNNFTSTSCFAMTWRGEEWTLATFDAMLFGFILIVTDQTLLAALITIIVWKLMKYTRMWFGSWNIRRKINLTN